MSAELSHVHRKEHIIRNMSRNPIEPYANVPNHAIYRVCHIRYSSALSFFLSVSFFLSRKASAACPLRVNVENILNFSRHLSSFVLFFFFHFYLFFIASLNIFAAFFSFYLHRNKKENICEHFYANQWANHRKITRTSRGVVTRS